MDEDRRPRPPAVVRAHAQALAAGTAGVDRDRLVDITAGMPCGRATLLAVLASGVGGDLGEWATRVYGADVDRAAESDVRALTAAGYDPTGDVGYYGLLDDDGDNPVILDVIRASTDGLDRWTRAGWERVPEDLHPVGRPYRELPTDVLADALVACAEGVGLMLRAGTPKAWLNRKTPLTASAGARDGVYAAVDDADTTAILTLTRVADAQSYARVGGQWVEDPGLLPHLLAAAVPLALVPDRDLPGILRAYDDHDAVFPGPVVADLGKPENTDLPGEGPTVAGLAVKAEDTGRVLMLQRALVDDDPAAGDWEFPGGHLTPGEDPLQGAQREWQEETGMSVPDGDVTGEWDSPDGRYRCFVWSIPFEDYIALGDRESWTNPDDPDRDQVESIAWWEPDDLDNNPALRTELIDQLPDVHDALDTGGDFYDDHDADQGQRGMMVALPVPDDAAQALAVPGGLPASDMHVTLAYLGTPDEAGVNLDTLSRLVEQWAGAHRPFTGEVSGPATFEATGGDAEEEGLPQVALVDAPGLSAARHTLVDYLAANGVTVDHTHDYTPHITRSYSDAAPPGVGGVPLTLDTVAAYDGEDRRDIPIGALLGDRIVTASLSAEGGGAAPSSSGGGWNEQAHPRDPAGKFAPKNGGTASELETSRSAKAGHATPVKAVARKPYHPPKKAGGKGGKGGKAKARKSAAAKRTALRKRVTAIEKTWRDTERRRHSEWTAAYQAEGLAERARQTAAQARIAELPASKRDDAATTESKRHLAWTRRRQTGRDAEMTRHGKATRKITHDVEALNAERDKQLAAIKADAAPIVAGHPYPGQKYKHGWIPVGPGAALAKKAPTLAPKKPRLSEKGLPEVKAKGPFGEASTAKAAETAETADQFKHSLDATVDTLHAKAVKDEPALTKNISDLVGAHGGHMEGLDFRLKTKESLARKISADAREFEVSPEQAGTKIFDTNRYTGVFPDATYAQNTKEVLDQLRADGNKLRVKNFWENHDNPYQGVNVQVTSPDGLQWELQFHTAGSLATKERAHLLFEKQRMLPKNDPQRDVLGRQSEALFGGIPVPPQTAMIS